MPCHVILQIIINSSIHYSACHRFTKFHLAATVVLSCISRCEEFLISLERIPDCSVAFGEHQYCHVQHTHIHTVQPPPTSTLTDADEADVIYIVVETRHLRQGFFTLATKTCGLLFGEWLRTMNHYWPLPVTSSVFIRQNPLANFVIRYFESEVCLISFFLF